MVAASFAREFFFQASFTDNPTQYLNINNIQYHIDLLVPNMRIQAIDG